MCEENFSEQLLLKAHIKLFHKDQKTFSCLLCGKKFKHSGSLVNFYFVIFTTIAKTTFKKKKKFFLDLSQESSSHWRKTISMQLL